MNRGFLVGNGNSVNVKMAQLQHWIVTCTTCDSPAEYHCNTCGDILCERCREIHQRSRGTGHHSIVPYSERIEPGKLTGQCEYHPGKEWVLWDQTCDIAACTECVSSAEHKGHVFDKIATKLDDQRKIIKEEFDMYSKQLKTWGDSLQHIQSNMKASENDIDELGKEISKAADRVCEQVRSIEAALRKQLQEMKKSQRALIQDQEKALTSGMRRIKQQIKEAEDKLRSEDVGVILHYKVKQDKGKFNITPETKTPPLPVFTLGSLDISSLENMIGSLYFPKKEQDETEAAAKDLRTTESHEKQSKTMSNTSDIASDAMSLITAATVVSTIFTDENYRPYLACTGLGQAWVKTGEKIIQLIDRLGVSVKTIITEFYPIEMAITPQGNLLISDYDKSIKLLAEKGEIQTLFRTEWSPSGLCCLQSGDIMVAFYIDGKVVQYSRTGKVVQELDRSLFRHPINIAQNKLNNHVYICDKSYHFIDATGKILALEECSGKQLYEYTGLDASTFTPWDICTDQAGHVIITDYSNDRIHILDRNGRFLNYMITKDQGLYRPFCIDADNNGYAWVSELKNQKISQLKLLKYIN